MAWHDAAMDMGGSEKPRKKVSHVTVRHAANGGHIITHHHTHPEYHPDEDHTTKGDAAMAAHMQDVMPDQNPDASAAAMPAAAAAPAAGAAPAAAAPGM